MKLHCTSNSVPRNNANGLLNRKIQSTITFFKNPKSEKYSLIVFSVKNKAGKKYDLNNNIKNILTRFINEGKATIQFKVPEEDLYIQADTIQLKSFLSVLRSVILGKTEVVKINCTADYVPYKPPVTKLVIERNSDFPAKGLPRTLDTLVINNLKLTSMPNGILSLQKLKKLDLSNNNIEHLPVAVAKLPFLSEIYLNNNNLGSANFNKWAWLEGGLPRSLKLLELSENKLNYIPLQLVKLKNLEVLNLKGNFLKSIPQILGTLKSLKKLVLSDNQLETLPSMLQCIKLDYLDVTGNLFKQSGQGDKLEITSGFNEKMYRRNFTLKELCGEKVLVAKIPFQPGDIPRELANFLYYATYCLCGRACFHPPLRRYEFSYLSKLANVYFAPSNNVTNILMERIYCTSCTRRLYKFPVDI